jgi:CubicO group peptidase (beta-lactamase class C family)
MNLRQLLRSAVTGLLPLIAAPSVGALAEGTFDIPAGAHFNPQKLERIGEYFQNEVATGKIPGAIILIQQHGQPVYLQSFGVRDVKSKLSITPDTIFRLFSMTKPITSVAAMMLIDQGKLALGDPVAKYIPSFANVKVGVEKKVGQWRTQLGIGSAESAHDRRRSDAANLRYHLWLLWRQPGSEGVSRRQYLRG